MKKIILSLALISLSCIGTFSVAQSIYTHTDFKITFPVIPTINEQDIEVDGGLIKMTSLMNEDANSAHMMSYIDYSDEVIRSKSSETMLQDVKGGFIGNLKVTVVDEKKIKIDNYDGIYFKASGNGLYCVMKDYMVNNRLYQIGILRNDRYPTEYEVKYFIDSFELISGQKDIKRPQPIREK